MSGSITELRVLLVLAVVVSLPVKVVPSALKGRLKHAGYAIPSPFNDC